MKKTRGHCAKLILLIALGIGWHGSNAQLTLQVRDSATVPYNSDDRV